jgi:class 3 adenylate cyclase
VINLPSGTVTFLFTDIEGSAALWERERQATARAVERHLDLLRGAITSQGGVVFKIVGDAVQAAFATAPAAVEAAIDAERALLSERKTPSAASPKPTANPRRSSCCRAAIPAR